MRPLWTTLSALCLIVVPAAAQAPLPAPPNAPNAPNSPRLDRRQFEAEALGQRKTAEVDGQLQRGDWAAVETTLRARLEALLRDGSEILTWPGLGPARALARLAVAEAGLGREEDALWHWYSAQALEERPLSTEQLRLFGAPGFLLAGHTLRRLDEAPAGVVVRRPEDPGGSFVAPRKLAGTLPAQPAEGMPVTYPEWLRLQVVVGADGKVSQPVLRQCTSPRLAFSLLDALRTWRFEPARLGGEAVAAFHEVSVNPPADSPALEQISPPVGEIAEVVALLHAGQWAKADKRGDDLWREALDASLQSRAFYGLALTLRALAEAGQDRTDEAICRWQAAQVLDPRLFHADLSAYGAPGELLERNRWGLLHSLPVGAIRRIAKDAAVERPEIRSRVLPLYPKFRKPDRVEGVVILEAVIDERGMVRDISLLKSGPGLDFDASSLDAVCAWTFTPARFEGQPTRVFYALTTNFQVVK